MIGWTQIWLFALVVKIVLGSLIPLSNDEAYYWIWSHNLQWSYYDHPAGVAWLFYLGHIFEPLRNIFPSIDLFGAVRIPALIAGHLSLLVIKKLIDDGLSETQHKQWLLVVIASPFFGIGSLIVTPDIPLIITWSLALLAFKKYLETQSVKNAASLGAALGLGFCAKYHIVLFVPIAITYVLWRREWKLLRPSSLAAVIFFGLLFSASVWGWNASHDWISFRFQLDHGLNQEARSVSAIFQQFSEYSGAQLALLSPLVFFTIHRFTEPKNFRFLRWFGWGPILFFAWTSLRSPVEANWPIAGHLPLLVLASINDTKRWLSRGMITLWTLASCIAIYQGFHPTQKLFGIPPENLKTFEFVRFADLESYAKSKGTGESPLFASSYQMAGALSVYSNRTVAKLAGLNRVDFFDYSSTGHPLSNQFEVALEPNDEPKKWPAWIAERGYLESQRHSVGRFTIVTFFRNSLPESHR